MRRSPLLSVLSLCSIGVTGSAAAADRPFVTVVAPAPSAQEVPTNTGLWLSYGVAADLSTFQNDPLLRDEAGVLIAPTWTAESASDGSVVVRSEPLDLDPEATYEVLTRLTACATEERVVAVCTRDKYEVLATFETGTLPDMTAPSVELDGKVTPATDGCTFIVKLKGKDDHTPAEALRFTLDDEPQSGATWEVVGGLEDTQVEISAIDLSGNESADLSVSIPACDPEDLPRDEVLSDSGCDVGHECQKDNGCSVGSVGRTKGTFSGIALLLSSAAAALFGRRRRVTGRTSTE